MPFISAANNESFPFRGDLRRLPPSIPPPVSPSLLIALSRLQKFFDPQDNALLPCFLSNQYYPDEGGNSNLDYMREFHGSYNGLDSTASSKSLIFKTDPDEGNVNALKSN